MFLEKHLKHYKTEEKEKFNREPQKETLAKKSKHDIDQENKPEAVKKK